MDLDQRLRAAGHRVTGPRRLVWEVLTTGGDHLTAHEILDQARAVDPALNLSSVYRTLSLLAELDLVRESKLSGEGPSRWELLHTDDMIHLVCDRCGAIDHHGGPFVEQLRRHLTDHHGFRPMAVEVTVSGRCARCGDRDRSIRPGPTAEA